MSELINQLIIKQALWTREKGGQGVGRDCEGSIVMEATHTPSEELLAEHNC